jgi:enamine deaminase RidA (YjgF/YER057c/UK114 family)
MRRLISSGSSFEQVAGYSRAVVDGDFVFVAGTTGYDYASMTIAPEVEAQARQALANIAKALGEAGSSLADVVRVTYYLTDRSDFQKLAPIFGEHFRDIRPASTAIICQLIEPAMKIEIEVTARRQGAGVSARGAQDSYPPGRA